MPTFKSTKTSRLLVDINNPKSMADIIAKLSKAQKEWQNIRPLLKKISNRVENEAFKPMIKELRQYPPKPDRDEEKNWTSPKQHRYIMWKWRKGDIKLPYERSGYLARSWRYEIRVQGKKIRFIIKNTWPQSQFVVGRFGTGISRRSMYRYMRPLQGFHYDTGWRPAYVIVQKWVNKAQEIAEEEILKFSESAMNF